jgi:hypothetical protein
MGAKSSAPGRGDLVESWLVLTLPGCNDPVVLECLSAHRLPRARGAPTPPYEFITRSPLVGKVLDLLTGQPLEFLLQSDSGQMQGYLQLRQVAADCGRLRFETTEQRAVLRQVGNDA